MNRGNNEHIKMYKKRPQDLRLRVCLLSMHGTAEISAVIRTRGDSWSPDTSANYCLE